MSLVETLAGSPGIHVGAGDGPESGPFDARIEVSVLPNGGVAIDYEATSSEHGVQHQEHTLLVTGPDGLERLYVAHSESPFVTEFVAVDPGSSRFAQPQPFGPYVREIVIEVPEPGRLTYAWWWAEPGDQLIEQSKADTRRMTA